MPLTPERLAALTRRARWDAGIAALLAEREQLRAALKNLMDIQDASGDCWCDDDGSPQPCEACAARAALGTTPKE